MKIQQAWSTIDVEYGSYNWLRREISLRIGHNADHKLLGRAERSNVDSIIEQGLHQFCNASSPSQVGIPSPPEGDGRNEEGYHAEGQKEDKRRAPHRWSFLNRTFDITTASGTSEYLLPDDFGATFSEPTTARAGSRIAVVPISHIKQLINSEAGTGNPNYCALERSSIGGTKKQTSKLVFYPIPNSIETISVEYRANPEALTDISQYPPGGVEHAETLLAYCMYVLAERTGQRLQEMASLVQDKLLSSIVLDRASAKPTADGVWVDDDGRFNLAYLSRMVGRHLGAGPNPVVWSHAQEQMIAEAIRQAKRMIYNPPIMPGERYPHSWTFLRPVARMITQADQYEYDLPDDFIQMFGPMTFGTNNTILVDSVETDVGSILYRPIEFRGETELRYRLQTHEGTGRPTLAAIRTKQTTVSIGTRYELLLWPVPNGQYEIDYRYRVNPDTSKSNSLPGDADKIDLHGGDRYSEMYLEASFLAADHLMGKRNSMHEERFMRAVQSAVGQDRLTHAPDELGYNHDSSDGHRSLDHHQWDENLVSYNGIVY